VLGLNEREELLKNQIENDLQDIDEDEKGIYRKRGITIQCRK